METWLAENPVLKRLLLAALSTAVVALNKKLGLNLGEAEIAAIAAIIMSALWGSNLKEAAIKKAEAAAAAVKTPEDAAAVLKGPQP